MFWTSAARRGSVRFLLRCWSPTSSHTAVATPRRPLLTSRYFSSSDPAKSPTHDGVEASPLRQWTLAVSPFTTVRARLGCNISIRPLDVHAYPEANRALISVRGSDSDQGDCMKHLQVRYDDQSQELLISAENLNSNVTIEMDAPIKSGEFMQLCYICTNTGLCLHNKLVCFCQICSSPLKEKAACK